MLNLEWVIKMLYRLFLILLAVLLPAGVAWTGPEEGQERFALTEEQIAASASFASHIGMETKMLSELDSQNAVLRIQLLEQEFERQGIALTEEEREYAENYFDEQMGVLEEMLQKGGSEQENAQEVLALVDQYVSELGISLPEYRMLVEQEISFSIKYQKLLMRQYDGDSDLLENAIAAKMAEAAG